MFSIVSSLLVLAALSSAVTAVSSYVFPFGSGSSISSGFHLHASVAGGSAVNFLIDTGSTGIVIAERYIGKNYTSTGNPFCLVYTSSNNSYEGEWVMANVAFSSGTVEASTQLMPVRLVSKYCPGSGGQCTTDSSAISVAMMGVGFDRDTGNQTDPCGNPIPSGINPFLMLNEMAAGSMVPGYIISPSTKAISLGITTQNAEGFELVQLQNGTSGWIAPTVEVAVPSSNFSSFNASLLVDTGLPYSIVQAPLTANPPQVTVSARRQVANGQTVVLTLPALPKPMYEFDTGDTGVAPTYVSWRHDLGIHGNAPFINTGRFALSQFDYLYNAGAGQLGFMPV